MVAYFAILKVTPPGNNACWAATVVVLKIEVPRIRNGIARLGEVIRDHDCRAVGLHVENASRVDPGSQQPVRSRWSVSTAMPESHASYSPTSCSSVVAWPPVLATRISRRSKVIQYRRVWSALRLLSRGQTRHTEFPVLPFWGSAFTTKTGPEVFSMPVRF